MACGLRLGEQATNELAASLNKLKAKWNDGDPVKSSESLFKAWVTPSQKHGHSQGHSQALGAVNEAEGEGEGGASPLSAAAAAAHARALEAELHACAEREGELREELVQARAEVRGLGGGRGGVGSSLEAEGTVKAGESHGSSLLLKARPSLEQVRRLRTLLEEGNDEGEASMGLMRRQSVFEGEGLPDLEVAPCSPCRKNRCMCSACPPI